jgi:hypothetical protein
MTKVHTLKQILYSSEKHAGKGGYNNTIAVDFSKPFIPEKFTQLYHTPLYSKLNYNQKLRYNQLCGIRTNEQFVFFESDFTIRVLEQLLNESFVSSDADLLACLVTMIEEEADHHKMFHELNIKCLPMIYKQSASYFVQLSWLEKHFISRIIKFRFGMIFMVFLILIMEEYSVQVSRSLMKNGVTESLGEVDKAFINIHQRHFIDESRHVHIDVHLLESLIGSASEVKRGFNSFITKKFLKEILAPKRAGINVIRHLLIEFPELLPLEREMISALRSFEIDPTIQYRDASDEDAPLMNYLLQLYPEFT